MPLESSIRGIFAVDDVRYRSVKRGGAAIGEGAAVVAELHSFWLDPLQRRVLEPLHPDLLNVHIAGAAVAHDRHPSSSLSGSRARMNTTSPPCNRSFSKADRVEPLDNAVPDHFADGRRRCAASRGRGDDGGQGASRRDHRKSRAQGANADERPEHDGGNARDIIPSNQIAAREARGFRELDRIPIDCSQLPDDGVMTGH
jgi:hypothetical protein